jgi:hypothetical protein
LETTEILESIEQEYLRTTLAWLDVLLEREVRRWQLAGQDASDRFRGLRVTEAEVEGLLQLGPGGHWGSLGVLPAEEAIQFETRLSRATLARRTIEEEAAGMGFMPRLKGIANLFGLNDFEYSALMVCLAPALDLRYERIYGYLQDDITRVNAGVDMILNLLLGGGLSRLEGLPFFGPDARLRKFRLILPVSEPDSVPNGLRQAFRAAPAVIAWLLNHYSPMAELGENTEFISAYSGEDIPETAVFDIPGMPSAEVISGVHPLLSLYGSDLRQQEVTARELAFALRRPLLKVNLKAEAAEEATKSGLDAILEILHPAVRDARMLQAILYIQGFDCIIDRDGCIDPSAFHVLQLLNDTVLISSRETFKFSEDMPGNDSALMQVEIKGLSSSQRVEFWSELLNGADEGLTRADLETLSGQFMLSSGQMVAAASTALSQALQERRALVATDLFDAARFHSGHHLGELAHKIEPRYRWEDLVLPETPLAMLHELVSMVKTRARVLEEWGLGTKLTASAGVSALFTGPPGTGKTLAAQIIANELSIDLYRIDLSTIVSKYIGETEKNLERIFNEAQTSNAILFFDEADAIFGKRSEVKDAHDRYANIEVGYLLQRMEAYDGVAILATNLRANLDEAFTRRLQFIINFPFPDEEYRRHIWEVLMPPALPLSDDLDLSLMARRFKLAGGNIRNIIVSAAYLAAVNGGRVTMEHLMHGTRREFQKMGRLVQETDFVLKEG